MRYNLQLAFALALFAGIIVNTASAALSTPTLSPQNQNLLSGNSITFTASWSGGTAPYAVSLYYSTTSTCTQSSALVQQKIGLSSNSVTFSQVTPSSNTFYCAFVTDNSLNPSVANVISSGIQGPNGVAFSPSGT